MVLVLVLRYPILVLQKFYSYNNHKIGVLYKFDYYLQDPSVVLPLPILVELIYDHNNNNHKNQF